MSRGPDNEERKVDGVGNVVSVVSVPALISTRALAIGCALVIGISLIVSTRAPLVATFSKVREKSDLLVLPNPQRTVVLSLGYRSALADLIFAHVLVSSGIHLQEKRRYETAAAYLETINELDPKFATPYRYADTILTVQATPSKLSDYEAARRILERGMRELPFDTELWLTSGQFFAYLAPARIEELANKTVAQQWRHEGAKRLARSCELIGKNDAIPYHCVTAARLFSQSGEREALLQFVERIMSVTDDPAVHEQALSALMRAMGQEQKDEMKRRRERLDRIQKNDLAFVGKDRYLLLGPKTNGFACFGPKAKTALECATSLREYHRRLDESGVNGTAL
jgi:tetratricopeptide (TPR) repeat protein